MSFGLLYRGVGMCALLCDLLLEGSKITRVTWAWTQPLIIKDFRALEAGAVL